MNACIVDRIALGGADWSAFFILDMVTEWAAGVARVLDQSHPPPTIPGTLSVVWNRRRDQDPPPTQRLDPSRVGACGSERGMWGVACELSHPSRKDKDAARARYPCWWLDGRGKNYG